MPLIRVEAAEAIRDLGRFDTLIDARSEGEFAEDRLPGAVNWPSLHDAERALIGTEYKQSAFVAKKRGAALVARNIAAHIDTHVLEGNDVAATIVNFARAHGVTQIFVTRQHENGLRSWLTGGLVQQIVHLARDMQVTIVADRSTRRAGT